MALAGRASWGQEGPMRDTDNSEPSDNATVTHPAASKAPPMATRLAGKLDLALLRGAISPPRKRRGPASLDHEQRMRSLEAMEAVYGNLSWLDEGSGFFAPPSDTTPQVNRLRTLRDGGDLLELRWSSPFEPLWSTELATARIAAAGTASSADIPAALRRSEQERGGFRERYLGHSDNRQVVARHYRHRDGRRPTILLLHGYLGGYLPLEARVLQAARYYRGGMNVALTALPFHGPRKGPGSPLSPPRFPGSDPRFTVEGFRQAVLDLRTLIHLLGEDATDDIGIAGMSLGGYTAALLTTIEPRLSFSLLRVPLGCLAMFADDTGRLVGTDEQRAAQRACLHRIYAPINPISRPPQIPGDRVFVTTGVADAVTGPDQSRPLVEHFSADERLFPGGHLWQRAHDEAQAGFLAMLTREGLWQRRSR